MDCLSCSPRSPCKPRASSGSFDKKLHRSSTCCKKNHPLWLVMYPVPISFIWWSLGHLLKILWTADPCQATSDKWLSPISQNLDPLTACCPHHVDTTYWYLRGVWLPLGSVMSSSRGVHTKAMFSLGELVNRKWREVVLSRRKPVLQNWPVCAQQVSQGHPKSSGQECRHKTVLHTEPGQRHWTRCWGEQLAKGMP